jgi:hypothetical protein
MRSCCTQAYARWNRTLSEKRTAARNRTAAAHDKQAPLDAYSSAREAGAPNASSLMTRIERRQEAAKTVIRWTLFYQMAGDKIRQIADCSAAVRSTVLFYSLPRLMSVERVLLQNALPPSVSPLSDGVFYPATAICRLCRLGPPWLSEHARPVRRCETSSLVSRAFDSRIISDAVRRLASVYQVGSDSGVDEPTVEPCSKRASRSPMTRPPI